MLSVDAAFDRIGSAFRQRGYAFSKEEKARDSSGDRLVAYASPNTSVRVRWSGSARLLTIQIEADGEWVDFTKRGFGPTGLEDTAIDALVRAVCNEVDETSTDPG
jgi:hypothetical protein